MTNRSCGILAKALVCALLTAGTGTAMAQQTIGLSKSKADWIIVGIAASGGAIGVGVYYVVRHDRGLTGCAFSGENGLQLRGPGEEQTYSLVGEVAGIKPGERVRVSGKKQKKNAAIPRQFLVEKLNKDFGPCTVAPSAP